MTRQHYGNKRRCMAFWSSDMIHADGMSKMSPHR